MLEVSGSARRKQQLQSASLADPGDSSSPAAGSTARKPAGETAGREQIDPAGKVQFSQKAPLEGRVL